ncbi:MAG TPA: alpha/beta family hydrolase [Streptosporangiaceae bacterium]|nr:alpha/beta family hydrolase [Streptosporangiaceae bacterium]
MPQFTVPTSQGPALVDWTAPASGPAAFVLALTHGAGGTPGSADLLAARAAAVVQGGGVALVTQPYRVRGARAPGNAERQDEAWIELMTWLLSSSGPAAHAGSAAPAPLIVGGRSNGARVACRAAAAVGARGVLALAFPLRPPARRIKGSNEPVFPPDRSPELQEAIRGGAHVLVLNGDRDPFGIPAASETIQVVVLNGETHSLSKNPAAVAAAVTKWLADLGLAAPSGAPGRWVSAVKREQSVKGGARNRL